MCTILLFNLLLWWWCIVCLLSGCFLPVTVAVRAFTGAVVEFKTNFPKQTIKFIVSYRVRHTGILLKCWFVAHSRLSGALNLCVFGFRRCQKVTDPSSIYVILTEILNPKFIQIVFLCVCVCSWWAGWLNSGAASFKYCSQQRLLLHTPSSAAMTKSKFFYFNIMNFFVFFCHQHIHVKVVTISTRSVISHHRHEFCQNKKIKCQVLL